MTFVGMDAVEILSALNNRFDLFAHRGYLLVVLSLYKVAFFLWLVEQPERPSWTKIAILYVPAVLFDLASGSRGRLFLESIFPLVYILHRAEFIRLNFSKVLALVLLGVALAVLLRVVVRDVNYEFNQERSIAEILFESEEALLGRLYDGPEAPYLDSLVYLADHGREFALGSTFAAVFTYLIPRALMEDKPKGASATFTERYFPDYYYPSKIEIAFPLPTEAYGNFWMFGLLVFPLLGWACGKFYNKINRSSNAAMQLICIFIVCRFVFLFRNDFFNNFVAMFNFSVLVGFVLICCHLIRLRPERRRSSSLLRAFGVSDGEGNYASLRTLANRSRHGAFR